MRIGLSSKILDGESILERVRIGPVEPLDEMELVVDLDRTPMVAAAAVVAAVDRVSGRGPS